MLETGKYYLQICNLRIVHLIEYKIALQQYKTFKE
jgi:hypothetical protein